MSFKVFNKVSPVSEDFVVIKSANSTDFNDTFDVEQCTYIYMFSKNKEYCSHKPCRKKSENPPAKPNIPVTHSVIQYSECM